jgi:2-methylfumaryl-CoA hydratase
VYLSPESRLIESREIAVTEALNTRSSVPLAEMSHLPHSFVSFQQESVVSAQTPSTSEQGNFFEDFRLGQVIRHATPRTVTLGDAALYNALFGGRFAVQSADTFAQAIGYPRSPIDDLLVFHIVFGKTVPDISLNAVANLGYANCRFIKAVYPGDTLMATSEVIGLKENSNRKTGIVYVRSRGFNQRGEDVLDYVRWVMVRKRDENTKAPPDSVPDLPKQVDVSSLGEACPKLNIQNYDTALAGSTRTFSDYKSGEKIDHVAGVTVEDAEHMMATRLYQNTARIHFDQFTAGKGRFGKRLIYGGHAISLARALSFNGLANAFHVAAINGGRHVNPLFAGATVFAWSEILACAEVSGRSDIGALRVRTVAVKDRPCTDFPYKNASGEYDDAVILDLDYWVALPR